MVLEYDPAKRKVSDIPPQNLQKFYIVEEYFEVAKTLRRIIQYLRRAKMLVRKFFFPAMYFELICTIVETLPMKTQKFGLKKASLYL